MRTQLTIALFLMTACSADGGPYEFPTCQVDSECRTGEICFPEGCADPGTGLVIEVAGNSFSGIYEQDLAVPDGTLGPVQDVSISGGLSLVGEFLRERTPGVDPTDRAIFEDSVQVTAIGSSDLIPGVSRSYQASFSGNNRGVFSMPISSGSYRVTAQPTSSSVPPVSISEVSSLPGKPTALEFVFPSVEGTVVLSGRLLRSRTELPLLETPLEVAMSLQAFDPITGVALSQRAPVSSGIGSKGDFILTMEPSVRNLSSVLVVAASRDGVFSIPTKTFTVSTPLPSTVTLVMGDFGQTTELKGVAIDSKNAPIDGATVRVEGIVQGGGVFRSKIATTGPNGEFSLEVLRNADGQPFTLTIAPRASHQSAATVYSVDVSKQTTPQVNQWACGDRVTVRGVLTRPDGSPAPGVVLQAVAQKTSGLTLSDVETQTDSDGSYSLSLDTGSWRIEFLPGEGLPRFSRLITVPSVELFELGTLSLPKGRRVTGTVTNTGSSEVSLMPNASIRYFRVVQSEGKPASVLLGSTLADTNGNYSIILPTR